MVLLCIYGFGQNPAWTLPDKYINFISNNSFAVPWLPSPATLCNAGVSPNQANTVYDGYDGQLADFSSNMMVNPQGEVEFFIVDGVIYDGEGNYINSMFTSGGGLATGSSETVIVPDPANCDRYYIIAVRVVNGIYEKLPFVFLLDMSLPNETVCTDCEHYGALVLQSCPGSSSQDYALPVECVEPSTVPPDPSPGKISNCFIAASDLQQGSFHWVFISNSYGIFRFKIDASGFNYDNSYISFGNGAFNPFRVRSEMELVELADGGFRLATAYQPTNVPGVWEYLYVVDLDANGNMVPGTDLRFPMDFYNPGGMDQSAALKGIEFSENGSRIYATHSTTPSQPNAMEYYDFGTFPVQLQPFAISSTIDAQFSGLELTKDDKLILANQNGLYQLPNATTAVPTDMTQMWAFNYNPTYEGITGSNFHKMYMLPDQIDGMDYVSSFVSSPTCCINSSVYEAETFVACSGTWSPNTVQNGGSNPLQPNVSADVYIKKELRIPAGVSVTINNMNLHFAPGAHLVIENGTSGQQGGRLVLNNTLLTVDARCVEDELWMGVEVWGNTNTAQGMLGNTTQGQLYVQSGSRIEHAYIGVLVGKRNTVETPQGGCPPIVTPQLFSFDYARGGGIVRTSNASFFSNQRGVYYLPYMAGSGANNLGLFSRTDFYWDGPLRGNLSPQVHAYLRQVKGVRFHGSSFRNATPSAFSYTQLGTGIFSYRAQFYVQPQCSVLVPPCTVCPGEVRSTFENLRFGVRAYNPGDLTFSVTRSDFDNCQYGAYVQYTKQEQLTENTFDVRQASYQTAGIALYNSPSFTVEENEIQGIGTATGSNSYGIVVSNSGILDNDVYLNDFTDLHIAGQSERVNAVEMNASNEPGTNPFNMSGLNWTCNNFRAGIELADLTVVNGRIDYFQGHAIGHPSMAEAIKGSARNHFSLHGEPATDEHDIMVSGSPIQELQYVGLNTPYYYADSYTPNWVLPLISSYNGTLAEATSNMCPSNCIGDKEVKESLRVTYKLEISDLEEQLTSPRLSTSEREKIEARLRAVNERLNLLEKQMVTDVLMDYESLSDLESELTDLGAGDVYSALAQAFAEDLSSGSDEPELDDPVEFLPIEPAGESRKTISHQLPQTFDFEVFPNPSTGRVGINFSDNAPEQVEAMVVDLTGRIVLKQNMNTRTNVVLNLTQLQPGLYNLVLRHGTNLLGTQKVEIMR